MDCLIPARMNCRFELLPPFEARKGSHLRGYEVPRLRGLEGLANANPVL